MRRRAASGRPRRHSAGQALVEFSLVMPVLFAVLFGLVDGARLVFADNSLSEAAREAARLAAVQASHIAEVPCRAPGCPATVAEFLANVAARASAGAADSVGGVTVYVTCTAAGATPPTGAWVTHNDCATSGGRGNVVSVRVVAQIRPLTPVLGIPFTTITMTAASTMTIP